jgi:hypothetical protein
MSKRKATTTLDIKPKISKGWREAIQETERGEREPPLPILRLWESLEDTRTILVVRARVISWLALAFSFLNRLTQCRDSAIQKRTFLNPPSISSTSYILAEVQSTHDGEEPWTGNLLDNCRLLQAH